MGELGCEAGERRENSEPEQHFQGKQWRTMSCGGEGKGVRKGEGAVRPRDLGSHKGGGRLWGWEKHGEEVVGVGEEGDGRTTATCKRQLWRVAGVVGL